MYFDFEDSKPDTPVMPSPLSRREGVLLSIIVHLVIVITILVGPELPFMKALEAQRQQELEAVRQREIERQRERARFVFIQPKVDIQALKPPPRAELSDIDRQARTIERAPNPTNPLPFSRGNTTERIVADAPLEPNRETAAEPAAAQPDTSASDRSLALPDAPNAAPRPEPQRPAAQSRGPAVGAIADAIRNVERYTQKEGFVNLEGGGDQEFNESIQFDSKGVEFGPWLRRFVAQVRRNWLPLIPYAAMTMRGRVVVTFFVHKDGRITDVTVLRPSTVQGFTHSAYSAILVSNPTHPLPPEYPDDKAFFTVTFHFNENPYAP
jgi:TonB family protein